MSNVLIDREKIDILANAIADKSGVPVTMTLDEMVEAVDGIDVGIHPTGNIDITSAGVTDVTDYATATVPQGDVYVDAHYGYYTENGVLKWHYEPLATIDIGEGEGTVGLLENSYFKNGSDKVFNGIAKNTSVTPTESSQTIGGANYMMEGAVTVNAIPSNYVGSGVPQRDSDDITVSGGTVSFPSGYYDDNWSTAVASGTAGTPTATKGTVSNHSISVTPSVTNTEGYISGGTINGTAVTVSASELVSDTYTVDSSGTKDVTNYASASVPAGTAGTPSASKGAVSNHAISVTPSVTNTTGFITGSTKTGTAVTVSASELVSGSETKTANGTYDVTNLAELVVDVASGSSKNAQVVQSTTRTNASALTAIGAELTVSKTGTYDIYYSCFRTNTSTSYTWATRLYINGTAYGTAENTTWTNNQQNTHLSNISLTVGDKLRVYGRNTRGTSYYVCAPMLVIVEA